MPENQYNSSQIIEEKKRVSKQRDLSFDAFRGVAIIFVVAIHSAITGWSWYDVHPGEWNYYATFIIKQFYVFAVPAFFFMSGYFVAAKQPIVKGQYLHFISGKLKRILIPYLIWSIIAILIRHRDLDLSGILFYILFGRALGPYYFLIVLAYLTLLSPVLFWLQRKPYGLLTIILINVITLIIIYWLRIFSRGGLTWWMGYVPFTSWIIFYYLGIVAKSKKLNSFFPKVNSINVAIIIVVFTLLLSIAEAFFLLNFYGRSAGGDLAVKFSSYLYSISFISLFLMTRKYLTKIPKLLLLVGEYSFGIYLIHELIRGKVTSFLSLSQLLYSVQPVFQWLVVILTVAISMVVIYITRKLIGKSIAAKYLGF